MSFQFLLTFTVSLEALNAMLILLIVAFVVQRFTMDWFSPKPMNLNITRCLIRSHLFYRGCWRRWASFILYSAFSSLLILDLMDVLCIADGDRIPFESDQRAVFLFHDVVIMGFSVMVLSLWNTMKAIDFEQSKSSWTTLYVADELGTEALVFMAVFMVVFGLYETWLSR